MNSMRPLPILFCCLLALIIYSCSDNTNVDSQIGNTSETEKTEENPYPAFLDFPNKQFKAICLGESKSQLENQIAKMPVEVIADEEDCYFHFPADSTELIVPSNMVLSEFKVFLKSKIYLNNTSAFYEFLRESSKEEALDDIFTVYYYETRHVDFKITLFSQPNYIRIHFLMTKLHI